MLVKVLSDACDDPLSRFLQYDRLKIRAYKRNDEDRGVGEYFDVEVGELEFALADHFDKVTHNDGRDYLVRYREDHKHENYDEA